MAFSDYETQKLREALLEEARKCAFTLGMRKTSVEQLTQAVGISKGSFYKFFESKELLFFTALESVHTELYGVADKCLSENAGLAPNERVSEAVLCVCKRLSDTGAMSFIENDAEAIMRRLPEKIKAEHYHDDETHIRQLLEKHELEPEAGIELAAATVRGLILTVSHQNEIGDRYPEVLRILIHGAMTELFK